MYNIVMNSFRKFIEAVTANLPIDQRLTVGWGAEDFIISVLENSKFTVTKSTEREDRGKQKLDAYVSFNNQTIPAQIKARESGNDILVEWYKDYERKVDGRDKIGKAKLYITMDAERNNLFLISTDAIKTACQQMFNSWEASGKQTFTAPNGQVRLQPSRDISDANKVMIYLKPETFRMKGLPGWPSVIKIPASMKDTKTDPRV